MADPHPRTYSATKVVIIVAVILVILLGAVAGGLVTWGNDVEGESGAVVGSWGAA